MSHIDTLKTFDDLVASGVKPEEARAHIFAMNCALDNIVTKSDLKIALESLEKDLKIFFGYLVSGTVLATFLIPLILAVILRYFNLI